MPAALTPIWSRTVVTGLSGSGKSATTSVLTTLLLERGRETAILDGDGSRPYEVFALEGAAPRPLSKQNDEWLASMAVGAYRDISGKAPDGTAINAVMVTPVGYQAGTRVPAFLYIHGGALRLR